MYEDDRPVHGEDQVRVARHALAMKPVPEPPRVQRLAKCKLRPGILAPDPGHHSRPGLTVHDVRHVGSPFSVKLCAH